VWEDKEKRWGVVPLDIGWLEMELSELRVMADVNAKAREVDSFLG